mgnify:CR=1 FL=1
MEDKLHAAGQVLKVDSNNLESRIKQLLEEKKKLEADIFNLKKAFANSKSADNGDKVETVNGVKFIAKSVPNVHPKELKAFIDEINKNLGSGIVVLGTNSEGKASLVVGVTKDLTGKYSAVDLVKRPVPAYHSICPGGFLYAAVHREQQPFVFLISVFDIELIVKQMMLFAFQKSVVKFQN